MRNRNEQRKMNLWHDCNNNFETIIFSIYFAYSKSIKIHICRLRAVHTELVSVHHEYLTIHYARLNRFSNVKKKSPFFSCELGSTFEYHGSSFTDDKVGNGPWSSVKKLLEFHSSFVTRCSFFLRVRSHWSMFVWMFSCPFLSVSVRKWITRFTDYKIGWIVFVVVVFLFPFFRWSCIFRNSSSHILKCDRVKFHFAPEKIHENKIHRASNWTVVILQNERKEFQK